MIGFFFHELVHLFLTGLVGGYFFWRYRDWRLLVAAFFFGFFIDIDHLFDYFVEFGWDFRLWQFLNVSSYVKPGKTVYVLFHGWEFIAVFGTLGYLAEKKLKITGLALTVILAYALHLLWDNFSFSHHSLGYFFTYRLWHDFGQSAFDAQRIR